MHFKKKPILPSDSLIIYIFDSDGTLAAADKLGSVEISLNNIHDTFASDTGAGVPFKIKAPSGETRADCTQSNHHFLFLR